MTLNKGLESVGEGCFFNAAIEEITIPKSVIHIGYTAFPSNTVILRPEDYCPEDVLTARMAREQL